MIQEQVSDKGLQLSLAGLADDLLRLSERQRERFFYEHMLAANQRLQRHRTVQLSRRRDDDGVYWPLKQRFIARDERYVGILAFDVVERAWVRIAHAIQNAQLESIADEIGAPIACSDNAEARRPCHNSTILSRSAMPLVALRVSTTTGAWRTTKSQSVCEWSVAMTTQSTSASSLAVSGTECHVRPCSSWKLGTNGS